MKTRIDYELMRYRLGSGDYARDCQFIKGYNERGLAIFCGQRSTVLSSYCADHYSHIYHRAPVFDAKRFVENVADAPAARVEPEVLATATAAAEEELEAA